MSFWLMKSEPDAYSIDDLAKRPRQSDCWDGIRNYQARNFMRDEMKKGDLAFFYHSSCAKPAVVGIMEIVKAAYPDTTAFDPESKYYDPKSTEDNPRWVRVDVQLKQKFPKSVSLTQIKANPALADMRLVQRGNRLSILPITADEWHTILAMKDEK